MPLGAIRSVYTIAQDMDLMQTFYGGALELPLAFRDQDKWCQFKAGPLPFALSSRSEAAAGARGSVIVFSATESPATQTVLSKNFPSCDFVCHRASKCTNHNHRIFRRSSGIPTPSDFSA